uniref:Uncharacterized protein n=1 Tax=Oryza meridionalis TaxID=40149 RepID=A0A0E0E0J6_9ORYZ
MMDLAVHLQALAAQSAELTAFLEDAESSCWHAASLRPRGRVFRQHRWRHQSAPGPSSRLVGNGVLQPRGGGVTHGEALTLPRAAAQIPGVAGGRATATSPLGLAMAPSLLAPSTEAKKTTASYTLTATQHGTGVRFSGAVFGRSYSVSAGARIPATVGAEPDGMWRYDSLVRRVGAAFTRCDGADRVESASWFMKFAA